MKMLRHIVRWMAYVTCLSLVGTGVFSYVRDQPRCTIAGLRDIVEVAADGSRIVTLQPMPGNAFGPLQVWDAQTGRLLHEWHKDGDILRCQPSPDGRHIALHVGEDQLRVVDFHALTEWTVEEPAAVEQVQFSSSGRWLVARRPYTNEYFVLDVPARKSVLRVEYNPIFSRDERLLFANDKAAYKIPVWDLEGRKVLKALPVPYPDLETPSKIRLLLTQALERKDDLVEVEDRVAVTQRFAREHAPQLSLQTFFSPDRRRLGAWLNGTWQDKLEMLDPSTGQLLWSHPMNYGEWAGFSPDGSLVGILCSGVEKSFTMLNATDGRVLWTRPADHGTPRFVNNTNLLLHCEKSRGPLLFLDARTGEPKAVMPPDFVNDNHFPMLTPDGRHFVIGGQEVRNKSSYSWQTWLKKLVPRLRRPVSSGVSVMEPASGRELLRVLDANKQAYLLSSDGSTLVTFSRWSTSAGFDVRIWDVRPTRAWLWTVGVVCGIVVCASVAGRMRNHRRPITAPSSS